MKLDRVGREAAAEALERAVDLGPVAAGDQVGGLELVGHAQRIRVEAARAGEPAEGIRPAVVGWTA